MQRILKESGKLNSTAVVSAMQYATGKDGLFYKMQDQLSETAQGKFSTLISNFKTAVSEASLKAMPIFKNWLDILIVKVQAFSVWVSANGNKIKEWISVGASVVKYTNTKIMIRNTSFSR